MKSFSPNVCSLPNSILNRLWHWFVHPLEIDGSLAKENQERFSIVIDFPFNRRVKSASINTLGQIFIRESGHSIEHLIVQCLKPRLETSDITFQPCFRVVIRPILQTGFQ